MRDIISTDWLIEKPDGELVEVNLEGWVHYHIDRRYGEDADGNRGESRTFVDDVEDAKAYKSNGDDYALTKEEQEQAEEILVQKFLMQ